MNIEKSEVVKYALTDLDALDPITVICEDLGSRQGKIIIECYGESWSAYWGGMGSRTIAQFFCSCDEHYLAKNLSDLRGSVPDYDNIDSWLKGEVISVRKNRDFSKDRARELWDDVDMWCENHEAFLQTERGSTMAQDIVGDDWWHCIPDKDNHNYVYLCRIINAVKEALKPQAACKVA